MKKMAIYCVTMAFFNCPVLKAQSILDINRFRVEQIDLPIAKEKLIMHPVAGFEVLDARPDNFCLGFVKDVYPKTKATSEPLDDYEALGFKKSIEKEILQNIMPPKSFQSNGFSFLLALKELWLYDNDNSSVDNVGNQIDRNRNTSGLIFRADVYLNKNESYVPLFQIDTIFIMYRTLERTKSDLLERALATLCVKLNGFPISDAYGKLNRTKPRTSIDSFHKQINKLAFTRYEDTLNQFIFPTFEDFKSGNFINASLRKFSDRLGDYYYDKDEKGNEHVIRSYAFFDKGILFIKSNNTYSPVFTGGSRVYTLGSKLFAQNTTTIPVFLPIPSTGYYVEDIIIKGKKKRSFQPMMLDMQTGNVY